MLDVQQILDDADSLLTQEGGPNIESAGEKLELAEEGLNAIEPLDQQKQTLLDRLSKLKEYRNHFLEIFIKRDL